jgi:hypothetical protein
MIIFLFVSATSLQREIYFYKNTPNVIELTKKMMIDATKIIPPYKTMYTNCDHQLNLWYLQ